MVASSVVEDTRTLVHRIRNDLQLLTSILHAELDGAHTDDVRAALTAMDRRMLAINLTYSGEESASVHLPRYLGDLCMALGHRLAACPERSLPVAIARRIGMVAVEALGTSNGAAELVVVFAGGWVEVTITRDASAGPAMDGAKTALTGVPRELVTDLLQQLGGRIVTDDTTTFSFQLAEP